MSSTGAAPRGEKKGFILCTLQKTRLAPVTCSHDGKLVFKEKIKQKTKHIHLRSKIEQKWVTSTQSSSKKAPSSGERERKLHKCQVLP